MRTKILSYKEYHTSQDNSNITVNEKSILKVINLFKVY